MTSSPTSKLTFRDTSTFKGLVDVIKTCCEKITFELDTSTINLQAQNTTNETLFLTTISTHDIEYTTGLESEIFTLDIKDLWSGIHNTRKEPITLVSGVNQTIETKNVTFNLLPQEPAELVEISQSFKDPNICIYSTDFVELFKKICSFANSGKTTLEVTESGIIITTLNNTDSGVLNRAEFKKEVGNSETIKTVELSSCLLKSFSKLKNVAPACSYVKIYCVDNELIKISCYCGSIGELEIFLR